MEIFSDPRHCMKKALTEDIACVLWKCHFEYGLHEGFTDKFGRSPFHTSSQTSYFLHDGYIWEPRAVFRHHIDRSGWSILETGISQYWLKNDQYAVMKMRFESEKTDTNGTKQNIIIESDEGPEKLKLAQFKGLFILFFCGVAFATAACLNERFGKKANKYFKSKIHDLYVKALKI
ncbi:unnamed protein product [Orchesella dallaii]|uniref:Uncharacterized protein n=1 Tax=Orchesella dallaii TaxID=48710 RepID=A0ABP1PPW7_9HEXA